MVHCPANLNKANRRDAKPLQAIHQKGTSELCFHRLKTTKEQKLFFKFDNCVHCIEGVFYFQSFTIFRDVFFPSRRYKEQLVKLLEELNNLNEQVTSAINNNKMPCTVDASNKEYSCIRSKHFIAIPKDICFSDDDKNRSICSCCYHYMLHQRKMREINHKSNTGVPCSKNLTACNCCCPLYHRTAGNCSSMTVRYETPCFGNIISTLFE